MEIIRPENALTTTLEKALDEIDKEWRDYPGIIITGSWPGEDDKEFVFKTIKLVQETRLPVLGICLGHQIIGLANGKQLESLGKRRIGIHKVKGWWGVTYESFWHDYGIGQDIWYQGNQIGVQFHPEYQSSKNKPHPVLKEFLRVCKKHN